MESLPAEAQGYMASISTKRIINTDDWREVVFFAVGGICALAILVFGTWLVIGIATSESEQVVSGPVILSSQWLELAPKTSLRPTKQFQNIVLEVDPTEGLVEDNLHPERMQIASGVLLKPEIQLLDSQGNIFVAEVTRSKVPSRYNNGLVGYVSDLPRDRTYARVRVRSNVPIHLSKIVWHCVQGK